MGAAARIENLYPPQTTDAWPIDYVSVFAWRQRQVRLLRNNPKLVVGAFAYYKDHPVEFINHWCSVYEPRNAAQGLLVRMPFILFQRQQELIEFFLACLKAEVPGLVEKCREMGATWAACAFSVWLWLFWPGSAVGWGSHKAPMVDSMGNASSILEKARQIILSLPEFFLPNGFDRKKHLLYMRLVNPENGATIIGESGDEIGRGGRTTIYFKDEASHYERPEKIEAALGDTTRVPIDISSVNGIGNVFHRRREAGADWEGQVVPGRTQVFVMDWRDHPAKNQEWYDTRKARAEADGLLHIFAQEVDRDYSASVEGILIQREWVQAAVDAHIKLNLPDTGQWVSALDVADEGGDTNAQASRQGIVLRELAEWGARDTAQTARTAVGNIANRGRIELNYDCIGVGSGVKGEVNNLADAGKLPKGIRLVPWNAGGKVLNPKGRVIEGDPDSPTNEDFYTNLKAQGWWELRNRFYRTWRMVNEGAQYDPDSLISLSGDLKLVRKLEKELCQVTASKGAKLKLVIDKTPPGTKSPNLADAVMMAFWPMTSGYDLERFING